LESNTDGLAGINVQQDAKTLTTIPLTVDQETIGMKSTLVDLSVPMFVKATRSNENVVEAAPTTFSNFQLHGPKFESIKAPSYYKECGPQLDQKLLNPAQRREILEFEKKKFAADSYARQAVSERKKVKDRLLGMDYKRGAIGYDNGINPESEIYGEKAVAYIAEQDKRQQAANSRRANLAARTSSLTYAGNILNPDLLNDCVKTQKFYQNKGGTIHNLTFEETYYRVLESNKEVVKDNKERTQYLRDQDLNGKNYNIVTHAEVSCWPSKSEERIYPRMMHPSQASLHLTRNMQGSTRPY
jgi:hypothetical protein